MQLAQHCVTWDRVWCSGENLSPREVDISAIVLTGFREFLSVEQLQQRKVASTLIECNLLQHMKPAFDLSTLLTSFTFTESCEIRTTYE